MHVGDIMSTVGVFSTVRGYHEYRGGYNDACGGYHEYRRGCSVPWGISWRVFSTVEGYHDPCGGIS